MTTERCFAYTSASLSRRCWLFQSTRNRLAPARRRAALPAAAVLACRLPPSRGPHACARAVPHWRGTAPRRSPAARDEGERHGAGGAKGRGRGRERASGSAETTSRPGAPRTRDASLDDSVRAIQEAVRRHWGVASEDEDCSPHGKHPCSHMCWRPTNATLIDGLHCCARYATSRAPRVITQSARLAASPLP
jgi:hypothetical protein